MKVHGHLLAVAVCNTQTGGLENRMTVVLKIVPCQEAIMFQNGTMHGVPMNYILFVKRTIIGTNDKVLLFISNACVNASMTLHNRYNKLLTKTELEYPMN